jgi:hypothetical protein
VYNDAGRLVLTKEHLVKKGINKTIFSLGLLALGVYFIKNNALFYFQKSIKVVIRQ